MERLLELLCLVADRDGGEGKGYVSILRDSEGAWKAFVGQVDLRPAAKAVVEAIPDGLSFEAALEHAIVHVPTVED